MIRGGLRTRLILDSARLTVVAALSEMGWFDAGRAHRPLRYIARPPSWEDDLAPNALAVSLETATDTAFALGDEVEDRFRCYADVFAEDDSVGWHLANDIAGLLVGKAPEVGRAGPVIDVFDLEAATPSSFAQVDVEDVIVDRAGGQAREWQRYWYMVRFDLVDEYGDEFHVEHPTTSWTAAMSDAWARLLAVT